MRYVLFAAVYASASQALDALRILTSMSSDQVAGTSLLHREPDGRTTLQSAGQSPTMRAVLLGSVVGMAAGLGSQAMWATAIIGGVLGALVGRADRNLETRELGTIVGTMVPPGSYAIVALADRELADRLPAQFDLASQTRSFPIAGRRMSELARCLARSNERVSRALDSRDG
jgi:hypothetical protein